MVPWLAAAISGSEEGLDCLKARSDGALPPDQAAPHSDGPTDRKRSELFRRRTSSFLPSLRVSRPLPSIGRPRKLSDAQPSSAQRQLGRKSATIGAIAAKYEIDPQALTRSLIPYIITRDMQIRRQWMHPIQTLPKRFFTASATATSQPSEKTMPKGFLNGSQSP